MSARRLLAMLRALILAGCFGIAAAGLLALVIRACAYCR